MFSKYNNRPDPAKVEDAILEYLAYGTATYRVDPRLEQINGAFVADMATLYDSVKKNIDTSAVILTTGFFNQVIRDLKQAGIIEVHGIVFFTKTGQQINEHRIKHHVERITKTGDAR